MYITQGLKRAIQVNANGIATIDGDQIYTWKQFGVRVAKLAAALQQLGLCKDSRVAILSMNGSHYLETYYAVPWADGILVPLNIRLAPTELRYMLNDGGVEYLIIDDAFREMLPTLIAGTNSLKQILYVGTGEVPQGAIPYEEAISNASPACDAERGGNQVAGIFYTGGTTGTPKGVMLSHDNIMSNTVSVLGYMYHGTRWIWPHTAPMFHLADCSMTPMVTIHGGTHLFIPKFDPVEVLQMVQTYGATHCFMVPTMLAMVMNVPNFETYDLSTLKEIIYAGSPMPAAIMEKAMKLLPNCRFVQAYGMTETSPCITFLENHHHWNNKNPSQYIRSGGKPLFHVEVKIVDIDGKAVDNGTVGEIITRGPHVMQGYWNKPLETASALRNGWMYTGDAGYLDDDGFVYIVDRYKDMIITGGENVYSVEVENALYQHSAVAMCAVIGIPDELWGETVHAIVVLKDSSAVSADELIQHCRELIAGYKCPRSIAFRHEPLPMSGAGKIMKAQIRQQYIAG
ncbi:MAG: long-chain fatty acid--CoA ligase [Caldilineaceae bacterium]